MSHGLLITRYSSLWIEMHLNKKKKKTTEMHSYGSPFLSPMLNVDGKAYLKNKKHIIKSSG